MDETIQSKTDDVIVDKIYTNDENTHYEITLLSKTKNIKSNEFVSYKLFRGNEDITDNNIVV